MDALRAEIIDMARKGDVDEALMAMLTGNAENAEAAGDEGRAKFLRKVAEVCVRERNNANGGGRSETRDGGVRERIRGEDDSIM